MSEANGDRTTDRDRTADRLEERVSNTAYSSTVGIMAGSVKGSSVYLNAAPKVTSPADLIAELDDLRAHLKRHHADGALDDDTYPEALAELDFARRAARKSIPESAKSATMALKRLRGLIADSPELAARLAPLVVAAGGLS